MAEEKLIVAACGEASRGRICGLDPLQRIVLAAEQAGVADVVVVAEADEHELWARRLAAHPRLTLRPRLVAPESLLAGAGAGAGSSSAAAQPAPLAGEVLLAAADTVWPPALLRAALQPLLPGRRAAPVMAAPAGPGEAAQFAGLARVERAALPAVLPALLQGSDALHGALQALGEEALEPRPAPTAFRRLRGPADRAPAEQVLLAALVKPADGVISRHINRKISLAISRRLSRTELRPNHVTAVVLLLGLLSGPLAARGDYRGLALGGLLYYLAAILDGCDGELSRLKHLGSRLGVWFDTVTDDLSALSFLCGLYWGLSRGWGGTVWLVLGGVAVGGNLFAVLLRYRILLGLGTGDHQKLSKAAEKPPQGALGRAVQWAKRTIVRTDFLPFAAFVTAAAGAPWIFAIPYPAGAVAAVVDSLLLTFSFGRNAAVPGSSTAS